MAFFKTHGKGLLAAFFAIITTCLFPCMILYTQNAGEARARDMLPFWGIFLVTALVVFLVYGLIFRNISRSGFMTVLSMLVVINFTLLARELGKLIPHFPGELLLLFFAVVLLALLILLLKKKPDMTIPCVLIGIAFLTVSAINLIFAMPEIIASASSDHRAENKLALSPSLPTISGEKQNVYFLIFDEYGGDENLSTYFNFDNSEFYDQLETRGFSVSHSTRNTESCWTDTLIPNLLNLDYVADDSMTERQRRALLRTPYLYQLFQGNGYQINLINHRNYLDPTGAMELSSNQREDNISEYLLKNSLFDKIPFIRDRISFAIFKNYRDNYDAPLANVFSALQDCTEHTFGQPTLTVSYIQSPHAPLVFRADGTQNEKWEMWNWKDETLYPQQLTYLNGLILSAIDRIQEQDPQAVILLLSDHGARVPMHMIEQFGGPEFDPVQEVPVMQNALCCVFVPNKTIEIEGDTGINAIRKTLNAAFDLELPMIPPAETHIPEEPYKPSDPAHHSGRREEHPHVNH